jgi:hypothetical protein
VAPFSQDIFSSCTHFLVVDLISLVKQKLLTGWYCLKLCLDTVQYIFYIMHLLSLWMCAQTVSIGRTAAAHCRGAHRRIKYQHHCNIFSIPSPRDTIWRKGGHAFVTQHHEEWEMNESALGYRYSREDCQHEPTCLPAQWNCSLEALSLSRSAIMATLIIVTGTAPSYRYFHYQHYYVMSQLDSFIYLKKQIDTKPAYGTPTFSHTFARSPSRSPTLRCGQS